MCDSRVWKITVACQIALTPGWTATRVFRAATIPSGPKNPGKLNLPVLTASCNRQLVADLSLALKIWPAAESRYKSGANDAENSAKTL